MRFSKHLVPAAGELVRGILHPAVRQHLGDGLYALAFVLFRLAMIMLFPVTVPLLAWVRASEVPANERRGA